MIDIRRAALNLLARREHSAQELSRKLLAKGFSSDTIQQTLSELIEEGLFSEMRFIESYILCHREKGYGPLRIRAELMTRGIHESTIEHHLNITDNVWLISVRQVWQKRFKGMVARDFATRSKQMRFLQYRGFTSEQINTIFHSDAEYAP